MKSLPEVMPVGEAREALSRVLEVFRREGRNARPVCFGCRRQAEAVIIPVELFEELVPLMEDVLLLLRTMADLRAGRVSGEPLELLPGTGDLSDCRKLYVGLEYGRPTQPDRPQ